MPGKSASANKRPLLSIEPTIRTKMQLNVHFKWWISNLFNGVNGIDNEDFNKTLLYELREDRYLRKNGSSKFNIYFDYTVDIKREIETSKIKQYVGEFY